MSVPHKHSITRIETRDENRPGVTLVSIGRYPQDDWVAFVIIDKALTEMAIVQTLL